MYRIGRSASACISFAYCWGVLRGNAVVLTTKTASVSTAVRVDGGEVIGIAVAVAPCTVLIVVACPESGAIPVAVGVLIHPDRTHPVPVAAAGLARVGSAEILRIVLSPFVPALLDAIAIAILISGLPRLGAITALIVVVVIIPLRACQSAERKCHDGQKRRKFDLSRHYPGHLRSVADFHVLRCVRWHIPSDAVRIISFVRA